ncbi:MAG: hypothetical protein QOG10_2591 [Kribbellaceae bacterium]|nr:hypothetical protein [Kribbellaceae bacterium]
MAGVGVGSSVGAPIGISSDGLTVSMWAVASTVGTGVGLTTGWCAAGSGTSGVFTVGPPSRLLASSATYAVAGTARNAPTRRIVRWRRPVESTKTGFRVENDFTSAE